MSAVTPGRAARDLRTEEAKSEFDGWFAAQGNDPGDDYAEYGSGDMAESFAAGMQAERDLTAVTGDGTLRTRITHLAATWEGNGKLTEEGALLRDLGQILRDELAHASDRGPLPAPEPTPPVGPGQAAWLKSVELHGPGHAATWYDLSDDERKHWALIANAGVGGSEYVRGLEAIAARQPTSAPELAVTASRLGYALAALREIAEPSDESAHDIARNALDDDKAIREGSAVKAAPGLAEPVTVAGVLCTDYPSVVTAMQAEIDRLLSENARALRAAEGLQSPPDVPDLDKIRAAVARREPTL